MMKMLVIDTSSVKLPMTMVWDWTRKPAEEARFMPHVIVEYSANIEDKIRVPALLALLHDTMDQTRIAEIAGLRTRAERRDQFRIADNHPANGFIAITIRIARGRSVETRKMVLETITAAVNKHLEAVFGNTPLSLSVEIQEIDPEMRINWGNIRDWMKTRENAA
jgi:5-carboxymethyl-2-hydroxymuconate isomerase